MWLDQEDELPTDEHLKQWADDTARLNAIMRAQGIEPNYECSFEDGVFTEHRKS